jgi:hypothetical protein
MGNEAMVIAVGGESSCESDASKGVHGQRHLKADKSRAQEGCRCSNRVQSRPKEQRAYP